MKKTNSFFTVCAIGFYIPGNRWTGNSSKWSSKHKEDQVFPLRPAFIPIKNQIQSGWILFNLYS